MIKKLFALEPKEVSLVDKGANKKKFLIFKEDKGTGMAKDKTLEEMIKNVDPKIMAKVDAVVKKMKIVKIAKSDMMPGKDSAVYKETHNVLHDGESDRGDQEMMDPHAQAALKAMARIAAPHKDKITHEHVMHAMKEAGIGHAEAHEPQDEGMFHKSKKAIPEEVKEEHHVAALGEAEKMYKSHLAKMGYAKYADPSLEETNGIEKTKKPFDDDEDDEEDGVEKSAIEKMLKAVPAEQRPGMEAIFKAQSELIEKNTSLEKELKVEREARVEKELIAKADQFTHLGVEKSELVAIMRELKSKAPEALEKFEKVLKAGDKQIKEGKLFDTLGSSLSKSGGSDAEAKLEALVDTYVAKSDGSSSRMDIYDRVLKTEEGKRLYKEFTGSRKGGI